MFIRESHQGGDTMSSSTERSAYGYDDENPARDSEFLRSPECQRLIDQCELEMREAIVAWKVEPTEFSSGLTISQYQELTTILLNGMQMAAAAALTAYAQNADSRDFKAKIKNLLDSVVPECALELWQDVNDLRPSSLLPNGVFGLMDVSDFLSKLRAATAPAAEKLIVEVMRSAKQPANWRSVGQECKPDPLKPITVANGVPPARAKRGAAVQLMPKPEGELRQFAAPANNEHVGTDRAVPEMANPIAPGTESFGAFLSREMKDRGLSDGDVSRHAYAVSNENTLTRQQIGRLRKATHFKKAPHAGTLKALSDGTGIPLKELQKRAEV